MNQLVHVILTDISITASLIEFLYFTNHLYVTCNSVLVNYAATYVET